MSVATSQLDRRSFLKTGLAGATGLVIGFYLPGPHELFAATDATATPAALNAWIHIGTDDIVTIMIDKSEMGQGVMTSLSMLAAEELECDWKKLRAEFAPAEKAYYNPAFGAQGTGGSSSIRSSYLPLLKAGAAAREMLIAAAARKWGVDKSDCRAENSVVTHAPTKRAVSYGSLAEAAAKLPVPANVPLKDPKDFRIVGKSVKRLDSAVKTDGSAGFGIDTRLPGMLYATVVRCPVFGGKPASFDATKAKAIPGVRDVIQISSGVAVVADNTWTAFQGRKATEIKWNEGTNASVSTDSISTLFAERADQPGAAVARKEGDAAKGLASGARKIDAIYQVPFMAHATMEPMNCTAHVQANRCDVWVPTQGQTSSQNEAAKITGLKPESVFIHTTYLGGGFGRRGETDFVADAVEISKTMGAPVKVTWTREEDTQHDFYRPASYSRFSAALDANGNPIAWTNRIVSPSIFLRIRGSVKDNLDGTSVEGAADLPYSIPNILVDYQLTETGIPVGFWRSVGDSQNGFFVESFMDELAAAAQKDPYEFRRNLLAKELRHRGVLDLAAKKAGWGTPLPKDRYRGIAVLSAYRSYVSEVVELSVNRKDGTFKVHRVVCAVDCGRNVNPDTIVAQMQSGIVYGLSALKGEITINRGRVEQANFNTYPVLRMDEMPLIEVYIVPSDEAPTGIGEPAVPVLAPAVCNAIFAATGKRIRRMPIRAEDLA
ncbi:MAG: molybdopterin cofactor-binding domain-containing protein [Candidatus Acidiferrales bacterium]